MPAIPSSLFFGLSGWFIDMCLEAEPELVNEEYWRSPANARRDVDFLEVFSGVGNLSAELLRVFRLHCLICGIYICMFLLACVYLSSFSWCSLPEASFKGLTFDLATDPMEDILSHAGKILCISTARKVWHSHTFCQQRYSCTDA